MRTADECKESRKILEPTQGADQVAVDAQWAPTGSKLAELVEAVQRIGPASVPELLRVCHMMDQEIIPALAEGMDRGELVRDGDGRYWHPATSNGETGRAAFELFHPHEAFRRFGGPAGRWLEALRGCAAGRPGEHWEFRQRHVSLRTSLMRALYLGYRGDLEGKSIALLGDDDLTSLALCVVGGFSQLTVLEADPDLVDFLRTRIETIGTPNVSVEVYDANDELPHRLLGTADTYLCDPSSRLYEIFLERGLQLLKPFGTFYSFVNPSHADPARQFRLQRAAIEQGWIVTDSVPGFNEYRRHPATYGESAVALYPVPSDEDDEICFTETLIRLARAPGFSIGGLS